MRGCVELWQDSDTADQGVIDDLFDHLGGIDLGRRVATVLDEIGPRLTDVGEALGIGDVPVERVQLGHGHTFDRPQNRLLVDIVAASVQKDSAIRILRTVHDVYLVGYSNLIAQVVEDDQLAEGLQCVSSSEVRARCNIGFHLGIILINFNSTANRVLEINPGVQLQSFGYFFQRHLNFYIIHGLFSIAKNIFFNAI